MLVSKLLVIILFIYYLAIFFAPFLNIFDAIEKFAGTKIFQFFRSWVFADRQSDSVGISVQGVTSRMSPIIFEF